MLSPRRSAYFAYCIVRVPEERLLQCLLINLMRLQHDFNTDCMLLGSIRNPGVAGKSIPGQKGPRTTETTGIDSQQRSDALNAPCWEALAQRHNRYPQQSESPPLSKISGFFDSTSVLLQHYCRTTLKLFQYQCSSISLALLYQYCRNSRVII